MRERKVFIELLFRIRGENFSINNQTVLVIKSGSMSDFYSDEYKEKIGEESRKTQFDIGDICFFECVNSDLVIGDVYAYKYKDMIITHRLISVDGENCLLRGDNNPISDNLYSANGKTYTVTKDKLLYHYLGKKIKGLGAFILYTQSYFGIWSICGILGVFIGSEVVYHKIDKLNKERYNKIGGKKNEK